MSALSIHNLSAEFGARTVLKSLDLTVESGELVGLIGPNGAGKTTLLRSILGLCSAQGSVCFDNQNKNILSRRQLARRVAYVPQSRDVAWPLSVAALVMLGRMAVRPPFAFETEDDQQAVAEAMAQMDVAHMADRPVTALSGGEQARALIARALAQATPVLLMDEPSDGLDPTHKIALMQILQDLAGRGRTILICLHDLWLAARWCSRIVMMDQGSIVADGPPETVLTHANLAAVYGVEAYVSEEAGGLVVLPTALVESNKDER